MAKEKVRLRSGSEIEWSGAAIDERHGAAIDDRHGAIIELKLGLWLSDWSSGFAGEVSLSLSLSVEML